MEQCSVSGSRLAGWRLRSSIAVSARMRLCLVARRHPVRAAASPSRAHVVPELQASLNDVRCVASFMLAWLGHKATAVRDVVAIMHHGSCKDIVCRRHVRARWALREHGAVLCLRGKRLMYSAGHRRVCVAGIQWRHITSTHTISRDSPCSVSAIIANVFKHVWRPFLYGRACATDDQKIIQWLSEAPDVRAVMMHSRGRSSNICLLAGLLVRPTVALANLPRSWQPTRAACSSVPCTLLFGKDGSSRCGCSG